MLHLLLNSLLASGLATLLGIGFGAAAAVAVLALPTLARRFVLFFAVIALAMPPFLVANCWLHYLGNTGIWRAWLPFDIFTFGGAAWLMALLYWPISLFAALSACQSLSQSQLESEPLLRGWSLFRWLLWPAARNFILAAAVLTFALALNQFTIPAILQVKVFPVEIWIRFSTNMEPGQALAAGWPIIILPLAALAILTRAEIRWNAETPPATPETFRRHIGPLWLVALAVTGIVIALSVGLPLAQLLLNSATWTQLYGAARAAWPVTLNSLFFAALSASLIVIIALLVRSRIFGGVLWLLFLLPGMLLSIGLIALLNRPVLDIFYRSLFVVIFVLVLRYAGPAASLLRHAYHTVDPVIISAATLDGLRGWSLFRHARWPRVAPSAAAAWYIAYLFCLWDVETLTLLYPPGAETLALRIFNLLHYGHNSQVNALCLVLLALAALPALAWLLWAGARIAFRRSVGQLPTNRALS